MSIRLFQRAYVPLYSTCTVHSACVYNCKFHSEQLWSPHVAVPSTKYEFSVAANTSFGLGDFSAPQAFNSAESSEQLVCGTCRYVQSPLLPTPSPFAAPTPPASVNVTALSSTVLFINWSLPSCDNGVRRGYIVRFPLAHLSSNSLSTTLHEVSYQFLRADESTLGDPAPPHNITAPDVSSLTITGLTPNTPYMVSVCAYTYIGCSENTSNAGSTSQDGELTPPLLLLLLLLLLFASSSSSLSLLLLVNHHVVHLSWSSTCCHEPDSDCKCHGAHIHDHMECTLRAQWLTQLQCLLHWSPDTSLPTRKSIVYKRNIYCSRFFQHHPHTH